MVSRSILTATVAAAALFVTAANAAPIIGTGSAGLLGTSSSTPSIGVGTVFSSALTVFAGGTGNLGAVTIGTFFSTAPVTATNGSVFSFTAAFGNFSGTISNVVASGPVNNRVVSLDALGTFTPLGVLNTFTAGPMSLTFSATQTGGLNSSVSASFTVASPPSNRVPEPATLALLGAGLLGLAVARRRKSA